MIKLSLSIKLESEHSQVTLELDDDHVTESLIDNLPFESRISTWGGEIYFPVPADWKPKTLTHEVEIGDVAYWPDGQSIAVFFGPTPMSEDNGKPVPADDVQLIGSVKEDPKQLQKFDAGEDITISAPA
jgi:hypothetical protein